MYLLFVNNSDYPKVKSVAEDLATDDHKVRFRNPDHFSGPKELHQADKVYLYGDYPDVQDACKEAKLDCEQLKEDGDTTGDEEPSMDWNKDELTAYAESNDIEVLSRDTKQDIMDKINEAADG
jgi:hypothetical protein